MNTINKMTNYLQRYILPSMIGRGLGVGLLMLAVFAFSACGDDNTGDLNLGGDCNVEAFALDNIDATIDRASRTILVKLPEVYNTDAMEVTTLRLSSGATCNIALGEIMNMGTARNLHVTNGNTFLDWSVSVRHMKTPFKPKAVFVGSAWTKDQLDPEARAACDWMLENVEGAAYAAWEDIRTGTCDLSDCKILWWHWHVDGGVDGHDRFVEKAEDALANKNKLAAYYERGGALLLTRYATNLAGFIGATKENCCPNNCWGGFEASAELCTGPWDFSIYTGQSGHALYQGIVTGPDANKVYCTDKGYHITNSTAQYHIGADWGGYESHDFWQTETGGTIVGVGGDGAVVAWEFPAKDGKGGVFCIGSGCFDWYSYTYEAGYVENYHKNIAIMTKNVINYLTK